MTIEKEGTDETQGVNGGDHTDSDGTVSKSEFTRVVGQRQELKSKIRDYEAKFAEVEAAKREAEEAQLRVQGENEKIIAARDAVLAETTAELEQLKWDQRFKNTVSAVAAKSGLDSALTEALLLREQKVSGADVALEEVTDDSVTGLAKALKLSAPSLFVPQGKGGSPNVPGLRMGNKDAGEDTTDPDRARVLALAKRLSTPGAGQ